MRWPRRLAARRETERDLTRRDGAGVAASSPTSTAGVAGSAMTGSKPTARADDTATRSARPAAETPRRTSTAERLETSWATRARRAVGRSEESVSAEELNRLAARSAFVAPGAAVVPRDSMRGATSEAAGPARPVTRWVRASRDAADSGAERCAETRRRAAGTEARRRSIERGAASTAAASWSATSS